MKRYQKILLCAVCLLVCAGMASYFLWKRGTPYSSPDWSPNGQYYIQRYRVVTISGFIPSTPGNGSDNIEGYVRLFDKEGNCLEEVFISYLVREMRPVWHGNKVYAVSELDDKPWILPSSSE